MKKLIIISSLAALAGCAAPQPGPPNYGTRAYAQTADPSQWQVVSVTPVPLGTGARAAAAGETGVTTTYLPAPTTVTPPVYVPQPVYVPPPLQVQPQYYYPPISIGLGFNFGSGWGRHHHHRGWGGARFRHR